jgi:hypothetical protein
MRRRAVSSGGCLPLRIALTKGSMSLSLAVVMSEQTVAQCSAPPSDLTNRFSCGRAQTVGRGHKAARSPRPLCQIHRADHVGPFDQRRGVCSHYHRLTAGAKCEAIKGHPEKPNAYQGQCYDHPMPERRHFPPPWSVRELDACFIVKDTNGQTSNHGLTRCPGPPAASQQQKEKINLVRRL